MTEFHVQVIRLGKIEKHPNADTLGLTRVYDYPVITRLGDFQEGDLAVYVPVDAIVPADDPRWMFLDGHWRIKAKRLRGIFSMGLLTQADPSWAEGQNVCELLRITKYEPPEPMTTGGEDERDPGFLPVYTDIEGLRRWPDILVPGEEVIITEKRHGANARWTYQDGRLWCASHHNWKKPNDTVRYLDWAVVEGCTALRPGAEAPATSGSRLLRRGVRAGPGLEVRSEQQEPAVHRAVRRDGHPDEEEFVAAARDVDLPVVPILSRGPWDPALRSHAEGKTTTIGADHVREGMVVRPVKERFDERVGRVILKLHGQGYLLRKEK